MKNYFKNEKGVYCLDDETQEYSSVSINAESCVFGKGSNPKGYENMMKLASVSFQEATEEEYLQKKEEALSRLSL
jgi:hypothetical protein